MGLAAYNTQFASINKNWARDRRKERHLRLDKAKIDLKSKSQL